MPCCEFFSHVDFKFCAHGCLRRFGATQVPRGLDRRLERASKRLLRDGVGNDTKRLLSSSKIKSIVGALECVEFEQLFVVHVANALQICSTKLHMRFNTQTAP